MEKIVPSLWFADNNCEEAVNYYVSVFPKSIIDYITHYPDADLDEHFQGMEGKVLTAVFHLNGQKFMALDGGPYFKFNKLSHLRSSASIKRRSIIIGKNYPMYLKLNNAVGLRINMEFLGKSYQKIWAI